ncbi:MAG: hypothetical protein R3B60_00480 [Candidatus Paceibacterota bacterium]
MDSKGLLNTKRLANNQEYYNNVFKKTENILSVIFYTMSYIEESKYNDFYIKNIMDNASKVQVSIMDSLSFFEQEAKDKLFTLQHGLLSLEGSLRFANSARILSDDVLQLLEEDIDLVQRYIRNHFSEIVPATVSASDMFKDTKEMNTKPVSKTPSLPRSQRVSIPKGDISSDAHMVYSQLVDRGTRIKTVLEAKPEATIKDIAEVITDVSEKTIQRELNSLIEKGEVIRQGERRWSKYSVVS